MLPFSSFNVVYCMVALLCVCQGSNGGGEDGESVFVSL